MDQNSITQIYETLAPMAGNYANAQAEQIGQAQRSMGPLAGNVMGPTTAGIGNYTYNRLMRPQIDVMRDEILVEGYRNQLNRALSDAYKTAQKNYNNRSSRSGGGSSSGTSGSSNESKWNSEIEKEGLERRENDGNFELYAIVGPDHPKGVQWKFNKSTWGAGFDTPNQSYEYLSGLQELRRLAGRGNKIYDSNGNNITSQFK